MKANQRRDYLKGTVSGSVQATDRLMKELRDIYKSPSFKSGAYQVIWWFGELEMSGSCDRFTFSIKKKLTLHIKFGLGSTR